jgi:hypothetical protein
MATSIIDHKLQALDARWIGDQADLNDSTLLDYEVEHQSAALQVGQV